MRNHCNDLIFTLGQYYISKILNGVEFPNIKFPNIKN